MTDNWRPICTAPRDRTAVLLSDGVYVCEGFFEPLSHSGLSWQHDHGPYLPQPTHWQPLPGPPQS